MKFTHKLISVASILIAFSSCDIDKSPYGNTNFWTSEQEAWMGLNSAWQPYYEEEGFGRGHWWCGIASDDMTVNRPNRTNDENVTNFLAAGAVNSAGGQYENWALMYQSIRMANEVLINTPKIQMPDASRNLIMGEANFICAFNYFYLAKRYGGLSFPDYVNSIDKPRETKTKTYENIEAYLLEAIKCFEAQNVWIRTDGDWGRPNLGAAYGLLAKVYAHWGKYDKAKAAAEKVINSGKYSLDVTGTNGYAHLFSPAGEKGSEVLFNLNNKPVRHQGTVTSVIILSAKLSGGTGWWYFSPTKNLYNEFEAGDTRRYVTMVGAGDTVRYLGKTQVLTADTISDMITGYMGNKYLAAYNDLSSWLWESGQDIPLLRYADVLLIHAEAEIFLAGGGPNNPTLGVAAAASSLNQVRSRAFGGSSSKNISAPTFNDLVHERRCELAYEDERHYDLVRWGIAQKVYAAVTTATDPRGPRQFDPVKNAHFALPQRAIDSSNGLLINNPAPGYSSFQ